ncbi:hypothetical protein TNCV_5005731 [Trichonephila clavipes]|nr:hypothetical protein TNCV_5005731 [Trichonephila clavipes]
MGSSSVCFAHLRRAGLRHFNAGTADCPMSAGVSPRYEQHFFEMACVTVRFLPYTAGSLGVLGPEARCRKAGHTIKDTWTSLSGYHTMPTRHKAKGSGKEDRRNYEASVRVMKIGA